MAVIGVYLQEMSFNDTSYKYQYEHRILDTFDIPVEYLPHIVAPLSATYHQIFHRPYLLGLSL